MGSSHPATDLTVPKTQKAALVEAADKPVRIIEKAVVQESELKPGEVLVKILYSGDIHLTGSAILTSMLHVAKSTSLYHTLSWVGTKAQVSSSLSARGPRPDSKLDKQLESNGLQRAVCLAKLALEGDSFMLEDSNEPICESSLRTGISVDGTFQQYTVSYAAHVTPIPESIPLHTAAPILCAGVTVYRAIKQSNTQPGDIVVISGAGGGLGHLAVQYAAQGFGLRVIAIDTGDNKRELCQSLGAETFVDFKTSANVVEEVRCAADGKGAHAVIVTSGSSAAYDLALQYLRAGGTLMAVGAPPDAEIRLNVPMAIGLSITVKGSYVGNREDARQALDMAARGRVKTTCRVESLDKIDTVLDELQSGALSGRIVLDMWS